LSSAPFRRPLLSPAASVPAGDDHRPQPRLSVVVAAWTGPAELRRCVSSLGPQLDAAFDEIIVVRNFAVEGSLAALIGGSRFQDLLLPSETVPRLRAAGLARATGTIVAFIEDHCTCVPAWRDAIIDGHGADIVGVGGPVDLGPGGNPLDWAVYFYDYARFVPPMAPGPARSLSGANMSWTQAFLAEMGPGLSGEVLEAALVRECARRGGGMFLSAAAIVVESRSNRAAGALRLAFAQARGYAAGRVAGASLVGRLALAVASVVLPPLLAARIVAATLRSRRHISRLVMALPWLAAVLAVWSAGEAAGYVAGEGASHRRWR